MELNTKENIEIINSLIKHTFFRCFRSKFPKVIPLDFYPFAILSGKDNLIKKHLPDELQNKLGFQKQVSFELRTIDIDNQSQIGFLVNYEYKWTFSISCELLLEDGFSLEGLDVIYSEEVPGYSNILAPNETLIGSIQSYNKENKTAIVETNNGLDEYQLNTLFPKKSKKNIGSYLSFKLGSAKAKDIFEKFKDDDFRKNDGKTVYDKITEIINGISEIEFKNNSGFSFLISKNNQLNRKYFNLESPNFIFDYGPGKTHSIADLGLKKFGPYDRGTFSPKNLKILIIYHKGNHGYITSFVEKVKNGIKDEGLRSNYFNEGFRDKYRFHSIDFVLKSIENYDMSTYRKAISISISENSDKQFHIAILEIEENAKTLSIQDSPYYNSKAQLMNLGIPVQFIKTKNIKIGNYNLQFILNAMCLQMYAKLGGTPWVIPSSQTVDRELIIGIGYTQIKKNWYANSEQSRIVGISTYFSGDGRYLMGSRCKDVPFEEYFEELYSNLKSSIYDLAREYAWQKGDRVRIVVHTFKPLKNIEIDVIDKIVSEITDFKIFYAFIQIKQNHPFKFFDISQTGEQSFIDKKIKGKYSPLRGTNQILNSNSCLIQMLGSQELKSTKQGMSRPLLIEIHEKSTFDDLNFILQQTYNFTYLSWKTFLASEKPVTIYYSTLIAELLGRLRQIADWNPDVLNTDLKFKKWFL